MIRKRFFCIEDRVEQKANKNKVFRSKNIDCGQRLEQKLKDFILSIFKYIYSIVWFRYIYEIPSVVEKKILQILNFLRYPGERLNYAFKANQIEFDTKHINQ